MVFSPVTHTALTAVNRESRKEIPRVEKGRKSNKAPIRQRIKKVEGSMRSGYFVIESVQDCLLKNI